MGGISRREAGRVLTLGGAGLLIGRPRAMRAAEKIDSRVHGVQIGAQSYSFRDRRLDACIEAFREVSLGECELWSGHIEPVDVKEADLPKWHASAPLSLWKEARQKFENAGVTLFAYTFGFRKEFTDRDIERGFQEAEALGVKYITSSANVSTAPRVDRMAQKYKITVGFHGHDETDQPDEFSTPETFARGLKGASKYLGINLDIGHFFAAGGDPVAYLRENHSRIVALHIKDRKKNHGPNMPFGQGDTPIGDVLRLLRDQHWDIPANIEYEYDRPGLDTIAEVRKCYDYMRRQLES